MAHYSSNGTIVPGLIRTGVPDTSEIRVVRSVYVDDDGIAKVNVANQIGVGPFHIDDINTGYTQSCVIALTSSINADNFDNAYSISSFNGDVVHCSSYGSYAFAEERNVNEWFMA